MTAEHVAAVSAIEADSFVMPWRAEHFAHELAVGPIAVARVVLLAGEVAGYASAWRLAGELKINKLAIAASWRRRGLGRWLLERLLDEAAHAGCRVARLEVRESNRAAQALYLGAGFVVANRLAGGYADGETAVLMEVRLDAPARAARP